MSTDFDTWSVEKKIKDSDLIFKKSIKSDYHSELFKKLANQMALLNPTFAEGLQILELLTDLILMGHDEDLFINSEDLSAWKISLKKMRYPQTNERDEELKNKFEKLPWPHGSKIKFERRGDRAGVELKIFLSSETDLTKALASLERVKDEMKS